MRRPEHLVPVGACNSKAGVVRAKFQILGAAIEPLRSTRENAGKSIAAKSGSDVFAK
jgi:hypothetical protein